MDLTIESNYVSNFFGIKITRQEDTIELKQTGLIKKSLKQVACKIKMANPPPAEPKALGKNFDGKPFNEQ